MYILRTFVHSQQVVDDQLQPHQQQFCLVYNDFSDKLIKYDDQF